ncbi:hypothetical protein GCM10027615_59670 [Plantactinospora veratri]
MHRHPAGGDQLTDPFHRGPGDLQYALGAGSGLDAGAAEHLPQPLRLGRTDSDERAGVARDERLDGGVRQQATGADDDEVVGGQRHLAHQVAGDEDGPALRRQPLHEVADPEDALRIEAVDRFVEQQHRCIAEQRGGDAEPLRHAERESAGPRVRHTLQADHAQYLGDPGPRNPVAHGKPEQVVVRRTPRMQRFGLEQGADLPEWIAQFGVPPPVDERVTGSGPNQAEQRAHRGGLAGAVRTEKPGDPSRRHLKGQAVDGQLRPVAFRQLAYLDHARHPDAARRLSHRSRDRHPRE